MKLFPTLVWQAALLLALAAACGVVTARYHPGAPPLSVVEETAGPGEITVMDALAREASGGVIWIDARRAEEFEKEHIPGALLLNEYDWENLLMAAFAELAQPEDQRPVIIYCDAKKCAASKEVMKRLAETPLGEREMHTLHGGWPAWKGR